MQQRSPRRTVPGPKPKYPRLVMRKLLLRPAVFTCSWTTFASSERYSPGMVPAGQCRHGLCLCASFDPGTLSFSVSNASATPMLANRFWTSAWIIRLFGYGENPLCIDTPFQRDVLSCMNLDLRYCFAETNSTLSRTTAGTLRVNNERRSI